MADLDLSNIGDTLVYLNCLIFDLCQHSCKNRNWLQAGFCKPSGDNVPKVLAKTLPLMQRRAYMLALALCRESGRDAPNMKTGSR